MSVRKRTWKNAHKPRGVTWLVDYSDAEGRRRSRNFKTKAEANAFHISVGGELRAGTHIPDSKSVTVAEAGRRWLRKCETDGLEPSTVEGYTQHLDRHIVPLIGAVKLSRLTVPMIGTFEDTLKHDRSRAMVRKVRISLGALLANAQREGLVGHNAVYERGRQGKSKSREAHVADRQDAPLQVGIDIPSPDEIRTIFALVDKIGTDEQRALFLTAALAGLRISEKRGLPWPAVDLKEGTIEVRQRADRYNKIGPPKTKQSRRTIPLPPMLVSALRKWKLACPHSELRLVFPAADGGVQAYVNITRHALVPIMRAAGLMVPALRKDGTPQHDKQGRLVLVPKYGWHSLRHFFASWCLNRKENGGLGLLPKEVQERMGHSSIMVTMDTYGHLFKPESNKDELAVAEKALFGA